MILADTSVWVEFLKANKIIFSVFRDLLESGDITAMECIFGELLQGARTRRERELILDYWRYVPKEDEHEIWIEAGRYSSENKFLSRGVGLVDSAIICFARKYGGKVWTLDKKLMIILRDDEVFVI